MSPMIKGEFVRTWYDEGGRFGGGWVYGIVINAGPRAFTVLWESGNVNARLQEYAGHGIERIHEHEREEAIKAVSREYASVVAKLYRPKNES